MHRLIHQAKRVISELTCTLFIFSHLQLSGQTKDHIPPSPTAASLGQYGDIPVSNYTGIPSISIPLTIVKSGDIELPITLNYHASGIKVTQEASWVGLGWSLSAGGVITRQVCGIDDFKNTNGYLSAGPLPERNYNYNTPYYNWFNFLDSNDNYGKITEYNAGMTDSEPDFFYYNFLGYSGKLLFQKQGGSIVNAIAVDQNNLIFLYNKSTAQWEITDGNGWKYYFQTPEVSYSISQSSNTRIDQPSGTASPDIISAWYLDKVETPTGDKITFSYVRSGRSIRGQAYYDEQSYTPSSDFNVNGEPGFVSSSNDIAYIHSASVSFVDEVYLQRIDYANGYLEFSTLDRQDRIRGNLSTFAQYLSYISIRNPNQAEIERVDFSYQYFNADKANSTNKENHLRLKLDQVQQRYKTPSGSYINKPPYKFTYNETPLPAKNSSSSDRWGYYNGSNNSAVRGYKFLNLDESSSHTVHHEYMNARARSTPFYAYIGTAAQSNVKIFINGANRDPNAEKMQAGILKSIHYPTGGVTKFNYEPNDYYQINSEEYKEVTKKVTASGTTQETLTFTEPTFIRLAFSLTNHMYRGDPTNTTVMNNMQAVFENSDGTDIIKFIPSDFQMDGTPGGNNNVDTMRSFVMVAVNPGSYRIKTDNGGYVYLSLELEAKYTTKIPSTETMGGGIRIQSVETYNNESGRLSKKTSYYYTDNDRSTGRLMSPIQNYYNETDLINASSGNGTHTPCCLIGSIIYPLPFTNYITTWSNTVIPLGSAAQGNPVGYDKVTIREENEDGIGIGSSVYYYKNFDEIPAGNFFPGIPNKIHLENGQLIREEHLNKEGKAVKVKTINYYKDGSSIRLSGVKTMRARKRYFNTEPENLPILARFYDIDSEWWYPIGVTETIYDTDGLNPVSNTFMYEYSNAGHKLLTRTSQKMSTGQNLVTTNSYPSDNPTGIGTPSATINQMINNNILNPLIKQEVHLDGNLVQGTINNYITNSFNDIVLNDVQKLKTGENTYEPQINFQRYDDKGRPLQTVENTGIITSYVWCYNNEYPVVKANNVSYDVLKTAVESTAGTTNLETFWSSLAQLDYGNVAWKNFNTALRNHITLKDAIVTTYTYNPATGITSTTDANGLTTYYEYDDMKRLKHIRNHNGEIVKQYKYHYANE